jgi:hypothetical protein
VKLWAPGRRKIVTSLVAFAAITAYAFYRHAPFVEYANAVEWLLGSFLFAHAGQQIGTFQVKP